MTQEELKYIEDLAGNFMSPKQIMIIMQMPAESLDDFKTEGHEVFNSYQKGKLMKIAEFRQRIIKMATEGSSAAQTMVNQWIDKQKEDELTW